MLKISIITATFNASATLADCLTSVVAQSFGNIEHILIDGGSKDETLALTHSYRHVSLLISEPDQGVYDAMNKGIRLAHGDIVGILNADDFYASSDVLTKVAEVFEDPAIDACFGDLVYVDTADTAKVVRYWRSGGFALRQFYWGWMPPHPTFFVRRSVYEQFGLFNLDLGSAADYELMLRFLVKHEIKAAYIPEVLVKMRTGGISNASWRNRLTANRMDRKAWAVNGLKPFPWTLWLKPLRKIGQWVVK
ncbi:MAG: glycosyltransferase family 2 protein [Desulfoprunum sp.]|nr:glycosyltransferase family 2 protein [Desulfoprunum sp.]